MVETRNKTVSSRVEALEQLVKQLVEEIGRLGSEIGKCREKSVQSVGIQCDIKSDSLTATEPLSKEDVSWSQVVKGPKTRKHSSDKAELHTTNRFSPLVDKVTAASGKGCIPTTGLDDNETAKSVVRKVSNRLPQRSLADSKVSKKSKNVGKVGRKSDSLDIEEGEIIDRVDCKTCSDKSVLVIGDSNIRRLDRPINEKVKSTLRNKVRIVSHSGIGVDTLSSKISTELRNEKSREVEVIVQVGTNDMHKVGSQVLLNKLRNLVKRAIAARSKVNLTLCSIPSRTDKGGYIYM